MRHVGLCLSVAIALLAMAVQGATVIARLEASSGGAYLISTGQRSAPVTTITLPSIATRANSEHRAAIWMGARSQAKNPSAIDVS
jgi:hypothetical protein